MAKKPQSEFDNPHESLSYRPPRFLRLVKGGLIGVIVVALGSVGFTALWFLGANQLRSGVAEWVNSRTAYGMTAGYEKMEISGYPLSFRIVMSKPRIGVQPGSVTASRYWLWHGSKAVAEMKPWRRGQLRLNLLGDQTLELGNGSGRQAYTGSAGSTIIEAAVGADGLPSLASLNIEALNLVTAGSQQEVVSASRVRVNAQRLFPNDPDHKTPTVSMSLDIRDAKIPQSIRLPLGNSLQQLSLEASILGVLPVERVLEGLSKWRDDGGTIEFKRLEARYGSLRATASGTAALDRDLQPIGALTARFEGFFATIDALRDANLIRSRAAAMAKLVLGSLSKRSSTGGAASISVPISLQERRLSVGPVMLMEIPAVKWPPALENTNRLRIIK